MMPDHIEFRWFSSACGNEFFLKITPASELKPCVTGNITNIQVVDTKNTDYSKRKY